MSCEMKIRLLKEVDQGKGTQFLQAIETFVIILHQSRVSIKVTWTDFIQFQMKVGKALVKLNMIQTYH